MLKSIKRAKENCSEHQRDNAHVYESQGDCGPCCRSHCLHVEENNFRRQGNESGGDDAQPCSPPAHGPEAPSGRDGSPRSRQRMSRSTRPGHGRRRRRQRNTRSSEHSCSEDRFEPSLKRPHENSCERCWR